MNKKIMELEAEIERLRKALRDQAGVELSEENDRLIAENERLRAEVEHLHNVIATVGNICAAYESRT